MGYGDTGCEYLGMGYGVWGIDCLVFLGLG